MLEMKLLSSIHRVLPQTCPPLQITSLSGLRNEPISFQTAYRLCGGDLKSLMVNVRVESALPVSVYKAGYVPVVHTDTDGLDSCPPPGLYPDLLLPKKTNPELTETGRPAYKLYLEKDEKTTLNAANDSWQSVWFIINEAEQPLEAGNYEVRVYFESTRTREVMAEKTLSVCLVPALLPEQNLIYANWFHCDCLADFYDTGMFDDRFFEIMENFVRAGVKNGLNMLLLPAFTPPLDTPIGTERRTAQLVGVTKDADGYHFDFSLMKRYIDVARKAGIRYFEHSHLFTQWGAEATPKIIATVDGEEKRIFGWDTKAAGEEYKAFLKAYIPAVRAFLRGENLEDKTLFHISDEPQPKNEATYLAARAAVGSLLDGCMIGDALSHYLFYEKGLVNTPICSTMNIHTYLGHCDNLWAYYFGGQLKDGLSNRILVLPPWRNRILGIEMYKHRIKGFLHWGFNYWYDLDSQGMFDPAVDPCGCCNTGGTSYSVYPGRGGQALQSIHQKLFYEGIVDMRALQALEEKRGRAFCDELLEKHFGRVDFHTSIARPEQLLAFREEVNQALNA